MQQCGQEEWLKCVRLSCNQRRQTGAWGTSFQIAFQRTVKWKSILLKKLIIFKKINFFLYSIRMLQSFTESENNLKFFSKMQFFTFLFSALLVLLCFSWCRFGCVYLRSKQCDQMFRLFFKFGHLQSIKISPIMSQICQSKLSILPKKK